MSLGREFMRTGVPLVSSFLVHEIEQGLVVRMNASIRLR